MTFALSALLAADFLTGAVHWFEDAYGSPDWPLLGKLVIDANIEHHLRPQAMTAGNLFSRNWQPALLTLAVLAGAWFVGLCSWWLALVGLLAAAGNEVHCWNHRPAAQNPRFVNWLHDAGLIQSRKQHGLHHRSPYDRHYCTLTNLTNAVLDVTQFWPTLELAIAELTGIRPRRMSPLRRGA